MAITARGIGGVVGGISGAVSDFFGADASETTAHGDFAAAAHYADAADMSLENKQIAHSATLMREDQLTKHIRESMGTQEAVTAGAGVEGGSERDLMKQSAQQGSLAKAVLNEQGALQERSYEQQAIGLRAQETSATAAGNAQLKAAEGQRVGGFMNILGAGIGLAGMLL